MPLTYTPPHYHKSAVTRHHTFENCTYDPEGTWNLFLAIARNCWSYKAGAQPYWQFHNKTDLKNLNLPCSECGIQELPIYSLCRFTLEMIADGFKWEDREGK